MAGDTVSHALALAAHARDQAADAAAAAAAGHPLHGHTCYHSAAAAAAAAAALLPTAPPTAVPCGCCQAAAAATAGLMYPQPLLNGMAHGHAPQQQLQHLPHQQLSHDHMLTQHMQQLQLFPQPLAAGGTRFAASLTSIPETSALMATTSETFPAAPGQGGAALMAGVMMHQRGSSLPQTMREREAFLAQETAHEPTAMDADPAALYRTPQQANLLRRHVSQSRKASLPVLPSLVAGTTPFDVGDEYELLKTLGQGSYGLVMSAMHKRTGERVAIKKISPFEHRLFCLRTLREIKLLKHFSHENVIGLRDLFCRGPSADIYVVQDLMQADLSAIIKMQQLSNDHIQYMVYQILRGLLYIHSANCLHRDLKPGNILINEDCTVRICDFGMARCAEGYEENADFFTEYVATRWYRAPEIMLTQRHYGKPIDVWSVGCIMAEMLGRRALFPGQDYVHQLMLIFSVLGTPTAEDLRDVKSTTILNFLQRVPPMARVPLKSMYPHASDEAIDLLEHLLVFDPRKRYTVEQALRHPYMARYHDPEDEAVTTPIPKHFFDFDYCPVPPSKETLRQLLLQEARSFRRS